MGHIRMNKKTLSARDRFGVARTNIVIGSILLLAVIAVVYIFANMGTSSNEALTADAATYMSDAIAEAVDAGFEELRCAAATGAQAGRLAEALTGGRAFSNARVEKGGEVFTADADGWPELRYTQTGKGRSVGACEAGIVLRLDAGEDGLLSALMPQTYLKALLDDRCAGGDYALYGVANGGYIINTLPLEGGNYYDALRALKDVGIYDTLMSSISSQVLYADGTLAQTRVRDLPWGVALYLPSGQGRAARDQGSYLILVLIAAACLLITFGIDTVLETRRIHRIEADARMKQQALEGLNHMAAVNADMALFLIDRENNSVLYHTNHLPLLRDTPAINRIENTDDIERACGIDEAELGRVAEQIYALGFGQVNAVTLHASFVSRDSLLRFEFKGLPGFGRYVLCCVRESEREENDGGDAVDEMNFRRSIRSKCDMIWEVDIENDRWRCVYRAPGLRLDRVVEGDIWRDYEVDLKNRVGTYLAPQDYPDFFADMCLEGLMTIYRKGGRDGVTFDDRVLDHSRAGYHWKRRIVRTYKDDDTGAPRAGIYIMDIDAQKNAELERRERALMMQKALTAISGIYYAIYYVDLDNDLCYTARDNTSAPDADLCTPYKAKVTAMVESGVHPDDREGVRAMLDRVNIRRQMTEKAHSFTKRFRSRQGENYVESMLIVQAARIENGVVREVVVALEHTHKLEVDGTKA